MAKKMVNLTVSVTFETGADIKNGDKLELLRLGDEVLLLKDKKRIKGELIGTQVETCDVDEE